MPFSSSSLSLPTLLRLASKSQIAWLLLAVVGAGVATSIFAVEDAPTASANTQKLPKDSLLREGAKVESKRAKCSVSGERLLLEFEDGRTLDALANLAAQRVYQACSVDETDSDWIVSGKITEFQNTNFLLLESVLRAPSR